MSLVVHDVFSGWSGSRKLFIRCVMARRRCILCFSPYNSARTSSDFSNGWKWPTNAAMVGGGTSPMTLLVVLVLRLQIIYERRALWRPYERIQLPPNLPPTNVAFPVDTNQNRKNPPLRSLADDWLPMYRQTSFFSTPLIRNPPPTYNVSLDDLFRVSHTDGERCSSYLLAVRLLCLSHL